MKGLKIAGIILVTIISVIIIIGMTIDGIVESGIEESGSNVLKTEVEVEDIDISLLGSSADMDGFTIYNPEGFSEKVAISLKGIEIDLDVQSLLTDQIIVNRIHVKNPEILFEQKGVKVNLRELSTNLESSPDDRSEKTIVIKEFILDEGKVLISSEIEKERKADVTIDKIILKDIGESDSETLEDAMKQVFEPIIRNAISEAVKSGLLNQIEEKAKELIGF